MSKQMKLVMYDIRGIQDYIFKTPKLKDAVGASFIVENIIFEALQYAVESCKNSFEQDFSVDLEWENEDGAIPYDGNPKDIQVLYIGGGNAFVLMNDENGLCLEINKRMSKYVLEHTYSLQLAIAICDKTQNYHADYTNIHQEMTRRKATMPEAKPLNALPIMRVEYATGLPVEQEEESTETLLKQEATKKLRKGMNKDENYFDHYVSEKGVDSTLAVVHIDGNNMGIRIRQLIEDISDYTEAVNQMREISHNITISYKQTFEEVQRIFNKYEAYSVLKVLVAGDDITYVCKGKFAVATVEYFVNSITKKSMKGQHGDEEIAQYGFSVCAGIAYMRSHFPFSIAYDVAELCCESAKDRAKKAENMVAGKVGNFFDFQFCKNVQTRDMDSIRENEYFDAEKNQLMIRPYEIGGDDSKEFAFENLRKNIKGFSCESTMPRSHAKKLRNLYSQGPNMLNSFVSFLESRDFQMPDGTLDMYCEGKAKFYDALELLDDYIDLSEIENKGGRHNEV